MFWSVAVMKEVNFVPCEGAKTAEAHLNVCYLFIFIYLLLMFVTVFSNSFY